MIKLNNPLCIKFTNNMVNFAKAFTQLQKRTAVSFGQTNVKLNASSPTVAKREAIEDVKISDCEKILSVKWADGHESNYHSSWLRFNCQSEKHKKIMPGQLPIRRADFPDDLFIKEFEIVTKECGNSELKMKIIGDIEDDHITSFPSKTLRELCYNRSTIKKHIEDRRFSFVDPQKNQVPSIEYDYINSEKGKFEWFSSIIENGFCVVKNVPLKNEMVLKVAEEISPLSYGTYEDMYNVREDTSGNTPEHAAYTTQALNFHQDVLHLEAVPGVQLLHAIRFDKCIEGGNSLLIDMFNVAEIMRKENPEDFLTLTKVPTTFATKNYDKYPCHVLNRKPIINVDYDDQIVGVGWNPGTEQPLMIHEEDVENYYKAWKKMFKLTIRKELQWNFRLEEGDLLVFNNRRMAHSREGYRSNGGVRHLQGTYCSIEAVRNKHFILGLKHGKNIVDKIVGNNSSV